MVAMISLSLLCRLGLDEDSISALGLDSPKQQPWVQVMLQYRRAALNPSGKLKMHCVFTEVHVYDVMYVEVRCIQIHYCYMWRY